MAWKTKLGWIVICLVAFVVVLVIAGYVVFRTQRFHDYVLAKLQQQASEATGGQVRIQNFALRPSSLTADAYGITIHSFGVHVKAAGPGRPAYGSSKDCLPAAQEDRPE